jgi:hypothetical protein
LKPSGPGVAGVVLAPDDHVAKHRASHPEALERPKVGPVQMEFKRLRPDGAGVNVEAKAK